jgi:hypothetical protein
MNTLTTLQGIHKNQAIHNITLETGHACNDTPHAGKIMDIMDILHINQRSKIY